MIHIAFLLNLTSILNKFCPTTTNTITYKTSNIINLCQNVHILITVLINICQHVPTTISHKGNCILLWRLLKYLVLTIVFCSPNFLIYCDENFSTVILVFSQVTKVDKREPRESFMKPRPQVEAEKCSPRFHFVYWGNLRKN